MNDKAGARTPLALVFASMTLALCLLFLTGLLENLPKAVLAAVVLTAVSGLFDFPALLRMWRVSRLDFYAAAIALVAVLLLGILQGILLAAAASVLMLLVRASQPHVAFLGRIPGTNSYSDLARHPDNEQPPGMIAFRPEASLIYVNAKRFWNRFWTVLMQLIGPPSAWSCAISRHRPMSILPARACCMSCTPTLPPEASHCASSERTDGCVTCCEPTAWVRRSEGSTGRQPSIVCSMMTAGRMVWSGLRAKIFGPARLHQSYIAGFFLSYVSKGSLETAGHFATGRRVTIRAVS